ncbi:unnamed protein product [Sphagnum troendelagicum]|uniref:Uncharacterized protein n=1 Tax=Sphagnum troendelagicum TaxID=128251 RepID=A0ABP0T8R1_9BRYO
MHETSENLGFGDPPPRLPQRSLGSAVSPFTRQIPLIGREMRKYEFSANKSPEKRCIFFGYPKLPIAYTTPILRPGKEPGDPSRLPPLARAVPRRVRVLAHTEDTRGKRSSQRVLARLGFSRLSRYYVFRRFGFSRIWIVHFFLLRFVGFFGSVWFGRCRDRGFRSRGSSP